MNDADDDTDEQRAHDVDSQRRERRGERARTRDDECGTCEPQYATERRAQSDDADRGEVQHADLVLRDGRGLRPCRTRERVKRLVLAFAAYVAVLSALAIARWHLWTYGTDTGTFVQVILDAFGGFRDGPERGTHFRFHWAPLLATLYPLVAITRSGLALQIAQIVLIGLSAFPLYGIARGYLSPERSAAIASLALLYPPLAAVAFTEFHEIAFYPALALGLVWAAERARWRAFALLAVASALVREEACIVLAIVGIVFATIGVVRRNVARGGGEGLLVGAPREPERLAVAGSFLTLVNVAALATYAFVVLPRVGPWQPSRFYEFPFAHGPAQLLATLATHPQDIPTFVTFGRFTYLLEAFVPLALLPFFSRWSLLALPGLAIVLLSSDPIAWRMGSHYAAIFAPWLVLGAAAALVRFARDGERDRATRFGRAALILCALVLATPFNPMHIAHYLRPVAPHDDVARALADVPHDAPIVMHDEWFAHVSGAYPLATVFFCPSARYALFRKDYPSGYFHDEIAPEIAREVARGEMRVITSYGDLDLYSRVPAPGSTTACITPGDIRYTTLPRALEDARSSSSIPAGSPSY